MNCDNNTQFVIPGSHGHIISHVGSYAICKSHGLAVAALLSHGGLFYLQLLRVSSSALIFRKTFFITLLFSRLILPLTQSETLAPKAQTASCPFVVDIDV